MLRKIIFLLISIQISQISSQSISCSYGQEPAGQIYTCTLTINNPNGIEFDSIPGAHLPGFGNEDVINLSATFQNTRNIPSVICRQFPNLQTINFGSSEISVLRANNFNGCEELTELSLVYNNIETVPDNTFRGNPRLTNINLARNNIRTFSRDSFTGSATTRIDMSQNRITEIIPGSFCTVNETLTTLMLNSNFLTSLPDTAFGCLNGLQHLHMSGNRNIQIPSTAFPSLSNLLTLNLMNCGLTTLEPGWFRNMQSLTEVHLESNSLASLPYNIFAVSRRLTNVFLSSNNLTELTPEPFGTNLPALEILAVVGNGIHGIDREFFETAENLHSLFLSGNICSNDNLEIAFENRDEMRRRLERCFRGFGPEVIRCEYEVITGIDLYGCHMALRNPIGNEFTAIEGEHLSGRSDNDVRSVDILYGNSRNVPQVICRQFPNLQQLIILDDFIEVINQQSFSNCANLEVLHLGMNVIMHVPDNTFSSSPRLRELYLGVNLIEIIGPNAFAGTALEMLDLSVNFFETVTNAWFRPIASTLRALDMIDVRGRGFRSGVFDGLTGLTSLFLNLNTLTEMDGNVFAPLTSLEELHMSSAALVRLNPNWFRTLSNLKTLYIARNDITDFPVAIFSNLTSLEELIFYQNQVVEIRADSFGPALPSVRRLYGSANQINSFDIDILDQATELNDLLLANNLCTDIKHHNIRGDRELTRQLLSDCSTNFRSTAEMSCEYDRMITGRIYWCRMTAVNPLGRNDFSRVEGTHLPGANDNSVMYVQVDGQNTRTVPSAICRQFRSMSILDLMNSAISVINEDSFHGCNFLRELTIMGNTIRSIPSQTFSGHLNHLHILILANNEIEDVSVYAFAGTVIQELDLSHNRIERYDPYTFSHIGNSLRVLRLTDNRITSLPSHAFDNLPNLIDLELNQNLIVTIPHNAFINNRNLEILQMANCGIERFEADVFHGLTRLIDLELGLNGFTLLPQNVFDLPNLRFLGIVQNELRSLDAAAFGRSLQSLQFVDASINRIESVDPEIVSVNSSIIDLDLAWNNCVDQNFVDIPQFRDQVLNALRSCITAFNEVPFSCEYSIDEEEFYACELTIDNPNDRMRFETVPGVHLSGMDNSNVHDVIAVDQNTRSIPSIICDTFSRLEILMIASSNVEVLTPAALEGCSRLFMLSLSNNRIIDIPDGIFRNTPELNILNLADNRIETLSPRSFEGAQIVAIDLELNNLGRFDPAWFRPVAPSLLWLFIQSNNIARFPRNAFSQFRELAMLELSGNQDIFIPSNAFNSLNHVLILHLANCRISSLNHRWFDDLNGLIQLELDQNEISELPAGVFNLPWLVYLGLAQNQLTVLESMSFGQHIGDLMTINAENNQINAIERGFIDNATSLDMLALIGNVCTDMTFMDIRNNRDVMIENLQQCFDNFAIPVNDEF